MKKAKIISAVLIIILIIPALFACSNRVDKDPSFNFDLKYGVGAKNEIDTFHDQFTKDMVQDPSITIKMRLTKTEMERIYQKMVEIDFFSYPDTFTVTAAPGEPTQVITPFNMYRFTVEKDSQTKTLNWSDEIQTPNDKAAKLRELIILIQRIIEAKEEYKELPEPGSAYL
jgi:hypothetical protein